MFGVCGGGTAEMRSVTSMALLPEGRLCSGGSDGTVRVWGSDWAPVRVLSGHKGAIASLACTKNGQLVIGSCDKTSRSQRSVD